MKCVESDSFEVVHRRLVWPWIAIDVGRARFAFASADHRIETRVRAEGRVSAGPSFALPADLGLPTTDAPATGHHGAEAGVHGFSIDSAGALLAVTGTVEGRSVLVTLDAEGERRRSRVDALAGGDFVAHAVTFDRSGTRLWVSAESDDETLLLLVDARSHEALGALRSPALPRPSLHELHVHPQDDAVLLLAACGQDGTFARVAGWSDGPPIAITTALDGGSISAGFVGFSSDGARVHLAEADELRTHAWPALEPLSSAPLADDFVSSYTGVVLGPSILVDGEIDVEGRGEDAVTIFDRSALRGSPASPPVPRGMWVGRLGADAVVTVEAKGDPARGRVVEIRGLEPTPAS